MCMAIVMVAEDQHSVNFATQGTRTALDYYSIDSPILYPACIVCTMHDEALNAGCINSAHPL